MRPRQTTIQVRRQVIDLATLLSMNPVATLNPATMELLSLFRGDTVICRYVWPDLCFSSLLTSIVVRQRKEETRHRANMFEFRRR